MLDIGSLEFLLLAIILLVVVGPERFPEMMRSVIKAVTRLQDYWQRIYLEFKQESGINEIKQDIRNQSLQSTPKDKSIK